MNIDALKKAIRMGKADIMDSISASPLLAAAYAFHSWLAGHDIVYIVTMSLIMGIISGFVITIVIRYLILTRYSKHMVK